MRKLYEKKIIDAVKLLEQRNWPADSLKRIGTAVLIDLLAARYCVNNKCITFDGECKYNICKHNNIFADIIDEKPKRRLRKIKVLES